MRFISRQNAIAKLAAIRSEFRSEISTKYEHRAKSCISCDTPGACCLDAHFVNVRITQLETEAIAHALEELPTKIQRTVRERTADCIRNYKLDESIDTETATYACPLFEQGVGCLVHETAKPLPCVAHACYDSPDDLPPDSLLNTAESAIHDLNIRTYGQVDPPLPIPLAISTKF